MRKVLSFVLVLAMILGSVSMVFATSLSDIADKDYAKAATALGELGVINGFADGTFRGESNVTRAQYATMVVRALGFATQGGADTGFKDVSKDSAYALGIKYGKELGIINGYTDGTFRPDAYVTCDQAIAMLIRALGYKEENLMGSYPTNCVNQAMSLELLDGVPSGSAYATRGNLAQLIFNAIDEPIVTDYNAYSNTWTYAAGASFITRLGYENGVKAVWTKFDDNFGSYGTSYTNKKDSTVKFFVPASKFVTVTYNTTDKVWKEADGTAHNFVSACTADAANQLHTITNFTNSKGSTTAAAIALDTAKEYTLAVYGTKDGADVVYATQYWNGVNFQAEEDVQDDIAKAVLGGKDFTTLADGKTIKAGTYFLNGVNALSEIKEDDIVTVYTAGSPVEITRVDVSNKTVEGTVTKIDANTADTGWSKYYIGSEAYKVAADGDVPAIGTTGTAYLNYAGKIVVWDETETADSYAIVLAAQNADGASKAVTGDSAYVKLFLADGSTASYKLADKVYFEGATDKVDVTSTTMAALGGKTVADFYEAGTLVAYKINSDSKITTIKTVGTAAIPANYKVTTQNTVDGSTIKDTTVVFVYKVGADKSKATTWSIGTTALAGKTITAGNYYASKNVVKAAVIEGTVSADRYVVYNGYSKYYDTTSTYAYEVKFFEDGEAKTALASKLPYTGAGLNYVDYNGVFVPTFDAAGNITDWTSKPVTTVAAIDTTNAKVTVSSDKTVVGVTTDSSITTPVYKYYTVSTNAKVYKYNVDDMKFELCTVTELKSVVDDYDYIEFYDVYEGSAAALNAGVDGIYDIVIVVPASAI